MPATSVPVGHIPARLKSPNDFSRYTSVIEDIENRILRLRVQAFAMVIQEIFDTLPQIMELRISGVSEDDSDRNEFESFESPQGQDCEDDLAEASDRAQDLHLAFEAFWPFVETSPFHRSTLEQQLHEAYDRALYPAQRTGGGAWDVFRRYLSDDADGSE